MFDTDRLHNANSHRTSEAVISITNGMERFKPEEQILGAAAYFLLLCEVHGVYPGTALAAISNMIRGNKIAARDQFAAAKMYIEEELKNG